MKTKIVAAVVDTRHLTLYKEDGETIVLPQGDYRVRLVLNEVMPKIIRQGYAELDLSYYSSNTSFREFEKKSGVARFFKVARDKLASLFKPEPVEKAAVGEIPTARQMEEAVAEILSNAVPVSDPGFNDEGLVEPGNIVEENGRTGNQQNESHSTHTVVAHVGGKIIPNMERIHAHFERAVKLGSTQGVERFLQRLAAVIGQRSHSVEDLLRFMERADMPIADDGSIIIYKVLKTEGDHFVDCHTQSVPQKVGSYVCMDISLVDLHRNNECSNGLHVARRGYIRDFSGDVCVLAKLAPEDVVTVPTYDANKMRVMGYHIVAQLPPALYDQVKRNEPITHLSAGRKLLGRIVMGDHIRRTEEVRIVRQGKPNEVVVTALTESEALISKTTTGRKARGAKPIPSAEALKNPKGRTKNAPVDPKKIDKKVKVLSRKDQAQKLYEAYKKNPTQKNRDKLVAYKKSVKLGWGALGITDSEFSK